jgi:Domain of unknown function (DUF4281)
MATQIFSIVNPLALVGWLLLALFPRRPWAVFVAGSVLPLLLSGVYVLIVVLAWGQSEGGFSSLDAVSQLFQNRWLLLAGWVHYLAFDLLVGSWIAKDAEKRNIQHLWVLPILALTFLFGPAGWLAYQLFRSTSPRIRPPKSGS